MEMKKLVFLTGAGISAESGITTFRDSGGLWEQYKVEDVATIDGYRRNPELVLNFYNERRKQLLSVKPNAAHKGVVELEKYFDTVVITQNVDNLHETAGSLHVMHLHGELSKVCSTDNPNDSRYIREIPLDQDVKIGDKAGDGSQLRPFIVWFGEPVPQMEAAVSYVQQADIFVVIGTSLNVYPAASLLYYVPESAQVFLIDPKPVDTHSLRPIRVIQKGASEGVKELTQILLEQK